MKAAEIPPPPLHQQAREYRTPQKEQQVLDYLSRGYSITGAAERCNLGRSTLRDWRNDEASDFNARVQEAIAAGTQYLEDLAMERGAHGTMKKIFHEGAHVDDDVVHHDVLHMFVLKARDRLRFADAQPKGPGSGDVPEGGVAIKGGLPEEPGT